MAHLEIGGRAFELAPYKLAAMRQAAPHIDAINATAGALSTFEGMAVAARSIIEVLCVGLRRVDETLTADAVEEMLDLSDMPKLQTALREVLEESGLRPSGEAEASSAPAAEKVSPRKSRGSSTS